MIFLHERQISTARSVWIYRLYGSDAIRLITENPYRLACDVGGIGFLSADRIAVAFGIACDSLLRIRAGRSHVLSEAMSEGHCGLPRAELIEAAARVLEVETGLVERGLAEEVANGTLIEDTIGGQPAVFLGWLFHSERSIAERLSALCAGPLPWSGIDADRALPWVKARTGISLAPSQAAALRQALREGAATIRRTLEAELWFLSCGSMVSSSTSSRRMRSSRSKSTTGPPPALLELDCCRPATIRSPASLQT
jgi:exodeoxyribonuclease V alpha subunit